VKFVVVCIGKLREPELRAVADEYLGRIRRYVRCDEIQLRDTSALKKGVMADATVVALEVAGEAMSSPALAQRLEQWGRRGQGKIQFLIGGADGLPADVSRAADVRLSLSCLTLPHRLARIVLYEQLYRGLTILRQEPYAREG
jgi:23S rRNA (pseudouridine1915-N3)-methyltransferase